jgi:hypothetical protein
VFIGGATAHKHNEQWQQSADAIDNHFEFAVSHSTTLSKLTLRVQLMLIIVHLFSVM